MYLVQSAPGDGPPPQRLMEEIGKLGEQAMKDGSMIMTGGLYPIHQAVRVRLKGGKLSVTDGPFAESKEVVGGYAIFEFATREDAIKSAVDFMELHRLYGEGWEGVCEMREMVMMADGSSGCAPEV
jgi:hypothetical protein